MAKHSRLTHLSSADKSKGDFLYYSPLFDRLRHYVDRLIISKTTLLELLCLEALIVPSMTAFFFFLLSNCI